MDMDFYSGTNSDELRKSPKGFIAVVLAVGIIVGGAIGAAKILNSFHPVESAHPAGDSSVAELISDSSGVSTNGIYTTKTVPSAEMNRGGLILVNSENAYVEYTSDLVKMYEVKNDSYYIKSTEVLLRKSAADALNSMMADFQKAKNLNNVQLISGYRTQEYQQELYDRDLQETGKTTSELVAKPGYSEHQTGMACDFNLFFSTYSEDFDGTGDYAWIAEHCTDYGFIIRYPENKTAITKIGFEPWHFRYVGTPHAAEMKRQGVCMEEYIELLGQYTYEGDHMTIIAPDKKKYEVYTYPADAMSVETQVPVPTELSYTISGNNVSGFVVTVDLGQTATDEEIAAQSTTTAPAGTAAAGGSGTITTETTTTVAQ